MMCLEGSADASSETIMLKWPNPGVEECILPTLLKWKNELLNKEFYIHSYEWVVKGIPEK